MPSASSTEQPNRELSPASMDPAPTRFAFQILHTTRYHYTGSVAISHHAAHLEPRATSSQRLLSSELSIHPEPAVLTRRVDYFGNPITFFIVQNAHTRLDVTMRSTVERVAGQTAVPAVTASYATARAHFNAAAAVAPESGPPLEVLQYLFDSPCVPVDDALWSFAQPSFPDDRPVLECVLDLMQRIHREFTFDPTATTVSTPLAQVVAERRGVCQDFAHLMVGGLRAAGLPARYVSGYLQTHPPPGQPKMLGADASHAWASVYVQNLGWIDLDPTNNVVPGAEHIITAWGRDYSDVAPLLGTVIGGGAQSLSVGVDVAALPEPAQSN